MPRNPQASALGWRPCVVPRYQAESSDLGTVLVVPEEPTEEAVAAYATILLRRAIEWARDLSDERLDVLQTLQPGSATAGDDAATAPYHLSYMAMQSLQAARDSLLTIGDLTHDSLPGLRPGPPYTLCRAAIENAAAALWLLTPLDRETRVLRCLWLWLDDSKDAAAASEITGQPLRVSLPERRDRFAAIGSAVGVPPKQILGVRANWTTIVKAADEHLGSRRDLEMTWRMCSGFMHARPWASLAALERGEMEDLENGMVRLQLSTSMHSLGFAAEQARRAGEAARALMDHRRLKWIAHARGGTP